MPDPKYFTGKPLPRAQRCRDLATLRTLITKLPSVHSEAFHQSSRAVICLATGVGTGSGPRGTTAAALQLYSINEFPEDLLLVGMIWTDVVASVTPRSHNALMPKKPFRIVVLVNLWNEDTMARVIGTLEGHTHRPIRETTPGSKIWMLEDGTGGSAMVAARMFITMGQPDSSSLAPDSSIITTASATDGQSRDSDAKIAAAMDNLYDKVLGESRKRVDKLLARAAADVKQHHENTKTRDIMPAVEKFLIVNTASAAMICVVPQWFWTRISMIIMVDGIVAPQEPSTPTKSPIFALSPLLKKTADEFDCVSRSAYQRFPILHTSFTYSSYSSRLHTLANLPHWSTHWPQLLHVDAYSGPLMDTIDELYTMLIRLAAVSQTGRDISPEACVKNAEYHLRDWGDGEPWSNMALDPASYDEDALRTTKEEILPILQDVATAVGCPVNAEVDSLAALIPALAPDGLSNSQYVAARIVWRPIPRPGGADQGGYDTNEIELGLSGDSPQYILLCLDQATGTQIDENIEAAWNVFLKMLHYRALAEPRIPKAMFEMWKNFCGAITTTINMLVAEEESEHGKDSQVGDRLRKIRENFGRGDMAAICHRSQN